MVTTTMVFGLCMCKWGIFALVGEPLHPHYHKFHVTWSQNACKGGTHCTFEWKKVAVVSPTSYMPKWPSQLEAADLKFSLLEG